MSALDEFDKIVNYYFEAVKTFNKAFNEIKENTKMNDNEENIKMNDNEMNIFVLSTGDVVVYRNGDIKFVLRDTDYGDILTSRDRRTYAGLHEYNANFTYNGDHQYDIVKVYTPKNKFRCLSANIDEDYDLVWEATEVKQLTVAEISELLGYTVEIVG